MGKGETVSLESLRKICIVLDCNIGDIIEFINETDSVCDIGMADSMGMVESSDDEELSFESNGDTI